MYFVLSLIIFIYFILLLIFIGDFSLKGNKKLKMTSVKIHPVQDMTAKEISKLRENYPFLKLFLQNF